MTKAAISWVLCLALVLVSGCSALRGISPSHTSFEQGLTLFNQGRFESAIPYFQSATREDPNFAEAYLYLGRSYISLSRWRSAIQPLRTALRLAPHQVQEEIGNLLIDAMFAAALNDFQLGDRRGRLPERLPEPFSEPL